MTVKRIAELRARQYDMERSGIVIDECPDEIEQLVDDEIRRAMREEE